jgi:probable rRNA maturation factor
MNIEIIYDYEPWEAQTKINQTMVENIIAKIMSLHPIMQKFESIDLSILLANDAYLQELSNSHMKKNKPTNVLSFPFYDIIYKDIETIEQLDGVIDEDELSEFYLGDMAFAYQTIEQEAKEAGISFIDHFTHLLIHGTLHLLGYDHIKDDEAEIMENLEIEILKKLGIKSPYAIPLSNSGE